MTTARAYDAWPHYPPVGGAVSSGWNAAVASLPAGPLTLAIDGPEMVDWADLRARIEAVFAHHGREVEVHDTHAWMRPWPRIEALTDSLPLRDDPDFATLSQARLSDLMKVPSLPPRRSDVAMVCGPGAALVESDVLWYADIPKRCAEASFAAGQGRNLGLPAGAGTPTTRRLFFIDWPIADGHRDAIIHRLDRWIDVQDASTPESIEGDCLRDSLRTISRHPFRVRPIFRSVSWGGHWAQRTLGVEVDGRDAGLGYELIAPENGLLIGDDREHLVEVPFGALVAFTPEAVLGPDVHAAFGTSFPIRFDYLDTVGGGDLSVHCHPDDREMERVFGFAYPQHESYYVMVGGQGSRIMLGLVQDADVARFEQEAAEAAEQGRPFDVFRYVQTHPATPHQLYAVPAGVPHGSGEGNVVLEISATPYLYSLRFYDWLRRDQRGDLRPVHVEHAFSALRYEHVGPTVASDLIPEPRPLRRGHGWREELLYRLPEVFYEVRRLALDDAAEVADDTDGTFHVLNVVDGPGVEIELEDGYRHDLAYAETIVVPAAAGSYRLLGADEGASLVVKALVS